MRVFFSKHTNALLLVSDVGSFLIFSRHTVAFLRIEPCTWRHTSLSGCDLMLARQGGLNYLKELRLRA